MLVDNDPQADLITSLGWTDQDRLEVELTSQIEKVIHDELFQAYEGMLYHARVRTLLRAVLSCPAVVMPVQAHYLP